MSRLASPTLLIGIALGLGLAALGDDGLLLGGTPAYGWLQRGWAAAGALLLLTGIVLQFDAVTATGMILFCGVLLLDWKDARIVLGPDWKLQALVATGALCVLYGMFSRLAVGALWARARRALTPLRWCGCVVPARIGREK